MPRRPFYVFATVPPEPCRVANGFGAVDNGQRGGKRPWSDRVRPVARGGRAMTDHDIAEAQPEGPWNPGISSALTRQLLALSTIFRPENALNDLSQASELQATTGLPLEQLAIFRPERLARFSHALE
jgi:hypothetical protein